MRFGTKIGLLLMLVALSLACSSSRRGGSPSGDTDSGGLPGAQDGGASGADAGGGIIIRRDGGGIRLMDGGGIVIMDGGGLPVSDAGAGNADSGSTGMGCPDQVVSPYMGNGCVPCLASCADAMGNISETCAGTCFQEDPTCVQCQLRSALVCANRNGCQETFDCLIACDAQSCGGMLLANGSTCDACRTMEDSFLTCLDGAIPACESEIIGICVPQG